MGSARSTYQAGDICSFRTSPATEFSARETGRYATLKVLGLKDGCVCFVVLDGVFDHHPTMTEVSGLPWLRNVRFSFRGEPACSCVASDWNNDLEDLRYLGRVGLTQEDMGLLASCRVYGPWSNASNNAECEWRWRNERATLQDEVERWDQVRDAPLATQREREEKRLKTLTWEKLLEEQPFARWNEHPPFPPPDFVAAARDRIRTTILILQALGPKPKKAPVRAVLKACVEWFNAKDAEFGGMIETEEREDICAALEELATVARHRSLTREVDEWRQW
jgi:hypothetical protein